MKGEVEGSRKVVVENGIPVTSRGMVSWCPERQVVPAGSSRRLVCSVWVITRGHGSVDFVQQSHHPGFSGPLQMPFPGPQLEW